MLIKIDARLPSPKGVALAIMEICRRDDATIVEIAKVVQTDPALSGRLLRLANAATHGRRPIAAVPDAILRLGLSAVRLLAMGFSLVDQYPNGPCQSFDYPGFWSHSLLMAVACQELGAHTRDGPPDELFVCGLLARIGPGPGNPLSPGIRSTIGATGRWQCVAGTGAPAPARRS